jgi:selT/selW/selH-like putative selenoprotein
VRAASLAAEIADELDVEATATPGGRGQFDVLADGALVFSKQQRGRFPEEGEVVRLLAPA